MKDIRITFVFLFTLISQLLLAQTFTLPDNNLRDKLLTSYPSVMQGNDLLLSAAASLTGVLDLSNANISDATGIEYFTSITTLSLSKNQLTTIPDISATSGLMNFYASDNELTSMPEFSSLTQIVDFQTMNNQLTALPDLTNSTGLRSLYCSNNEITSFPDLTLFPQIQRLVIGENPYAQPLDFSSCVNLEELHIHKTNTDTIIGLDKLVKLKILFAWGNNIRDISGLNNNTTLVECAVFKNKITEIPNLDNKPNLVYLDVNHCSLTFEDIQPVLQSPPTSFVYSSPNTIPYTDQFTRETFAFTLSYPIENPLSSNVYVWFKDGVKIDSTSSPTYNFSPAFNTNAGSYVLKIYNSDVPNVILSTDTFQLAVGPCLEFTIPFVSITKEDCSKGYTFDITNAKKLGGTSPFTYEVTNDVFSKTYVDEVISEVPAGAYTITIMGVNGCTATDKISLSKMDGCDPVITPDGDGVADTYFIETPGTVKIYDLKRYLVKTLEAPVSWDGTDRNGAELDAGYYILIQEGQPTVFVTLLR